MVCNWDSDISQASSALCVCVVHVTFSGVISIRGVRPPAFWTCSELGLKGAELSLNKNGENAYLVMKYPRPHAWKGSLCSHDAAAHRRQFRPVTIWGPTLIKSWIRPCNDHTNQNYWIFFMSNYFAIYCESMIVRFILQTESKLAEAEA